MKDEKNSLFPLIHDYLMIYLPKQRKVSPNTIRSHRKALEELPDYGKETEKIPLGSITFAHLTAEQILAFLTFLKSEKDCSAGT